MTYKAVPCSCGWPTCKDWHVSGVAQVQGVSFSEEQAGAVAALLNEMNSQFPDWMGATEKKIAARLLDTILADSDLSVEVYDEAEKVVDKTRDRAAIERETAQTGYTYYVVFRGEERLGFIWLVHGNGGDVITDYANKPEIEAVVNAALQLAGVAE